MATSNAPYCKAVTSWEGLQPESNIHEFLLDTAGLHKSQECAARHPALRCRAGFYLAIILYAALDKEMLEMRYTMDAARDTSSASSVRFV
jgi:hypothetical protein